MKKILLALAMAFSLGLAANEGPSVEFKEGNFFAITQQFDQQLLDNFAEKILNYKEPELYIYFDTPGGSVIALSRMARLMKSSDIKFTCVANFAASAGFMLFQHCDTRLLLSDGILMSHNWSGGFRGEAPRILTMYYTIQAIVDTLEQVTLSKMNVDAKEYARLINNNLWMTSSLATKYAAIDGIAGKVTCTSDLIEQRNPAFVRGFFSRKRVSKSGCPLIQKTYTKQVDKKKDIYLETGKSLFDYAQTNYKLGTANMIYLGKKHF